MSGAEQPARCRRPDTGHQEGVSPFALVLSWCVWLLNHLPCAGPLWRQATRAQITKKPIPLTGLGVSLDWYSELALHC